MSRSSPTILKVLDLSTAHLTPMTLMTLNGCDPEAWPVSGGNIPYGFFIYAHDENDGSIPDDLWACIEYARKHGCSHLRFDADADVYADLKSYQEEHA